MLTSPLEHRKECSQRFLSIRLNEFANPAILLRVILISEIFWVALLPLVGSLVPTHARLRLMAAKHFKKPMQTDSRPSQLGPGSGASSSAADASSARVVNRTASHESHRVIRWDDLAEGNRTVRIELNELQYQLRLTKAGKLILTK